MLGGLLSRQEAEEEERQLREAEQHHHQANNPSNDTENDVVVSDTLAGSGSEHQYGSLGGSDADNIGMTIEEENEDHHYADEYEEDNNSYSEGEYSYSDDDDHSDNESDDGDSDDDDDDDDGSTTVDGDEDGDHEGSYLLHHSSQRRRRRRRKNKKDLQGSNNWKRSFRKATRRIGSKIRAAVVAIADVDNVWDSPDANHHHNRHNGGAYAEDQSTVNNSNNNGNNNSNHMIYDVITGGTSTRNRAAAMFWFIFLSTSYASERSSFKLLVDRVGPFRLFSAELILGAHALLTGLGMLMGRMLWKKEKKEYEMPDGMGGFGLGLPLADVGLMAVLDTVYLLVGCISGAHVPPVLTVILVQATIPLTACFTQCVHPDGRCTGRGRSNEREESSPGGNSTAAASHSNVRIVSNSTLNEMHSTNDVSYPDISSIPTLPSPTPPPVKGWGGLSRAHIIGTGLMFLAMFLGLTPAVLSLDHIVITTSDAMPDRTAYNTIVFCFAAIPAAISQLYKERCLTRLRQPVDRNTLNMVLSIFQLLFAIVVSPLAYGLQGMGDVRPGWTTLYPSKDIGQNFSDGMACFIGTLDKHTMENGYPEEARCNWAWALVLINVLSIVMVGVAIDKLAAATKVMYRGVSMGIIFAVILMFIYQIQDKWCEYGPLVSFFHLTATAVLILGAEIYHRVSLVDSTFETVYPEIGDLYEEEE